MFILFAPFAAIDQGLVLSVAPRSTPNRSDTLRLVRGATRTLGAVKFTFGSRSAWLNGASPNLGSSLSRGGHALIPSGPWPIHLLVKPASFGSGPIAHRSIPSPSQRRSSDDFAIGRRPARSLRSFVRRSRSMLQVSPSGESHSSHRSFLVVETLYGGGSLKRMYRQQQRQVLGSHKRSGILRDIYRLQARVHASHLPGFGSWLASQGPPSSTRVLNGPN
jgi:hypothetical protein